MDFKPTFTKNRTADGRGGFALAELVVAIGITGLLLLTVITVAMFSSRSFVALSNYVELDSANQLAIDQLTRDLREANRVKSTNSTGLVLEAGDGSEVSYRFNADAGTVSRIQGGTTSVVLRGCDRFRFSLGQRNPVGGSYDVYPAATPDTCKVVNVAWSCSRSILGLKANTESVQTARIVIRKQGT